MMVLLMHLEMFCQVVYALCQNGNLDLGRTSVIVRPFVLFNRFLLGNHTNCYILLREKLLLFLVYILGVENSIITGIEDIPVHYLPFSNVNIGNCNKIFFPVEDYI